MIGCDDDRPYEWFHVGCVGLNCILQGEWSVYILLSIKLIKSYQGIYKPNVEKLQCMYIYNKLGMKYNTWNN